MGGIDFADLARSRMVYGSLSVRDDSRFSRCNKIDGANAAQTLRLIIIPLMKQTFKFAFIMDAISSLRMYTEAAVLTAKDAGGVAREVAEGVINLLMFNLNSGNFGMACAYGWIIFVIIFVISLFILGTFREKKEKGR